MTAESYNSTMGGNLRFVGHAGKLEGRGTKGFPALVKADAWIFYSLFLRNHLFDREGRSPKNVWEISHILACSSDSDRVFSMFFYSDLFL